MTDTPKKPPDQDRPPATPQGLTLERLEAMGFKVLTSSGRGYFVSVGGPAVTPMEKPE